MITPYRSVSRRLLRLTWNEYRIRFSGSILGLVWVILTPLMILLVYAAVYAFIFKVRVPDLDVSAYVLMIFSGLIPFLMVSEAVNSGTNTLIANRAAFESTTFPIQLVVLRSVLSSQGAMLVGIPVLVFGSLVLDRVSQAILLLPLLWLLLVVTVLGVVLSLSVLTVFIRDIKHLIGVTLMVLLIASPFAYTPDMVPAALTPIIRLNPFAYFVTSFQDVVVFETVPPYSVWIVLALVSLSSLTSGIWVIRRMKMVAADHV